MLGMTRDAVGQAWQRIKNAFPCVDAWQKAGDILLKWVTIFAILSGGAWAYYNFYITDVESENVQLDIGASTSPYGGNKFLLVVQVKIKNIGRVAVEAKAGGFNLYLRRVPNNFGFGRIDSGSLAVEQKLNIDKKYGGYVLEPGVEYTESEGFIVPAGAIYQLYTQFDLSEEKDAEIDTASFVRIE
jgi:hypothetical protein